LAITAMGVRRVAEVFRCSAIKNTPHGDTEYHIIIWEVHGHVDLL